MPSFLNVANNDGATSKRRPRSRSRIAGVTTTPSRLPNTALKAAAAVFPVSVPARFSSTASYDHGGIGATQQCVCYVQITSIHKATAQ